MADFEIYEDFQQEWRWRMIADNGRIMADSAEGYDSASNAHRAVDRFLKIARKATIQNTIREIEGESDADNLREE